MLNDRAERCEVEKHADDAANPGTQNGLDHPVRVGIPPGAGPVPQRQLEVATGGGDDALGLCVKKFIHMPLWREEGFSGEKDRDIRCVDEGANIGTRSMPANQEPSLNQIIDGPAYGDATDLMSDGQIMLARDKAAGWPTAEHHLTGDVLLQRLSLLRWSRHGSLSTNR